MISTKFLLQNLLVKSFYVISLLYIQLDNLLKSSNLDSVNRHCTPSTLLTMHYFGKSK